MKYKKVKQQKPSHTKPSHTIPSDFITQHRYSEIADLLENKTELTKQERYLYGYSLFRTDQKLKSLITFWPLVKKGCTLLEEDCKTIAADVFKDENFLSSSSLSLDSLHVLYLAAKNLAPNTQAYDAIKHQLFDSLWSSGNYEKLERILKTDKEGNFGVLVENLSKLAFLQLDKKITTNPLSLVSLILTGGASLIARESIYHSDVSLEIQSLANEIKHLFLQLKNNHYKSTSKDRTLFEAFVDYEADVLIQILQLFIKNPGLETEIIPTPGFLIDYDAMKHCKPFLQWLRVADAELHKIYDPNIHQAIIWTLGHDNTSLIQNTLRKTSSASWNPYLRLSIKLRAALNKKMGFPKALKVEEFENMEKNSTTGLFKNVTTRVIRANTADFRNNPSTKTNKYWEIIQQFHVVFVGTDVENILIEKYIKELHENYQVLQNLNFEPLATIAREKKLLDLEKQSLTLSARQKECEKFLHKIDSEQASKKVIKQIKNETTLREHLCFIADSCLLNRPDVSIEIFWHIQDLTTDKRINKIIPLNEYFGFDEKLCDCLNCQCNCYRNTIPEMSRKLSLSTVKLPDPDLYSSKRPLNTIQNSSSSVLLQIDPFKTLGVSLTDSKTVVMQKIMALIQQSPQKMTQYRQAQNELFQPERRLLHQYFRYFVFDTGQTDRNLPETSNLMNQVPSNMISIKTPDNIPLRHEYLTEHG